jgi:hypothetical protein
VKGKNKEGRNLVDLSVLDSVLELGSSSQQGFEKSVCFHCNVMNIGKIFIYTVFYTACV